jgi:hypothetical protein
MNAITYKEIFPLLKDNKMWLGNGFQGGNAFSRPKITHYFRETCWLTAKKNKIAYNYAKYQFSRAKVSLLTPAIL